MRPYIEHIIIIKRNKSIKSAFLLSSFCFRSVCEEQSWMLVHRITRTSAPKHYYHTYTLCAHTSILYIKIIYFVCTLEQLMATRECYSTTLFRKIMEMFSYIHTYGEDFGNNEMMNDYGRFIVYEWYSNNFSYIEICSCKLITCIIDRNEMV